MKCKCTAVGQPFCGSCGCLNNPDGPARRNNGQLCKSSVMPATFRCNMHGGTSAPAQHKAMEAMALLRMPGIEALYDILETTNRIIEQWSSNTCPTCSYPKGDIEEIEAVVKAMNVVGKTATAILDRTGIPARATLEIKQADGDLDLSQLTDRERERMMTVLAELDQMKEDVRKRLAGEPPAQVH
jgi:hypothetical protein